jgi:hypothetical protein
MLMSVLMLEIPASGEEHCSIYVDSEPSGADVILDSVKLGVQTPTRLDDLSSGHYIIRVEKADLVGERAVTLQPNIISRIVVSLTTRQIELMITSEPAGAEVLINGEPRGQTPYRFQAAGYSTYRIGLRSIGYLAEDRVVELMKAGAAELHVVLRRYGELRVESAPSGAEIYLDGEFQGRTPTDLRASEGAHNIALRRVGSREHVQEIQVEAGKPLNIGVTLVQENGELTVIGLPDRSEVTVDEQAIGIAPINRVVIPAGPHWLHYHSEGFEPLNEPIWISIQGRQETVVTITVQEKTRWNAIWRSLLFPGIGQMYSEQSLKGLAFLGAGALCVAGTILTQYQVNDAQDNYQIAHDRYVKEISPFGIESARENMVNKHELFCQKVERRNTLIIATSAIWAFNTLDQILFSSTPWKGGVKATTRFSFRGSIDQQNIGCQLVLEW